MTNRIYLSIIILFSLLTISCSKDEVLSDTQDGYLELSDFHFSVDGEVLPATKAVDESLAIEIWQSGTLVEGQHYEPGTIPARIRLAASTTPYMLKAFTPDYTVEAEDGELGSAAYYSEKEFTISAGEIITLSMIVPMYNIGITATYPELMDDWFTSYQMEVTSGTRTVTIKKDETAYFNLPADSKITYTLQVTNLDGESQTSKPIEKTIEQGKTYKIEYTFQ